jgi:MSHA pilin protein MshC
MTRVNRPHHSYFFFQRHDGGFTLVELVVVLIVIGIISAVAIPRFANVSTFNTRQFGDQALALVRYGQKMAVGQNVPVYVRLNGSSVALCYDSACSQPVAAPNNANSGSAATLAACSDNSSWECEGAPSGVSVAAINTGGTSFVGASPLFYFSPQGKPYKTGDSEPNSTFTSQMTVTISGSGATTSFYVEQETGYVHR